MRKILFVDDETKVVRALRRMLFPMQGEWGMTFCGSGAEALLRLAEDPHDVVVSDMRMPEMDGIELLTTVRERHPGVVRIVLSGHADRELLLRSTEVAHQFLAKPCDPDELRSTVERMCSLRAALSDERLLQLTASLKSIPSLPSLYTEVMDEMRAPSGSLESVGRIIAKDIGMTTKVLQLVNSAFFGLSRQVGTPQEAASFLGLDTLQALVLTVNVFSQFEGADLEGASLESFLEHGMTVGNFARGIARLEEAPKVTQDRAYLAGMLHDVGKLVLAAGLPGELARARAVAAGEGAHLAEVEQRILGASHANVAAYLLGIWGLPIDIVEAVARHHDPQTSLDSSFTPLTAVHAANAIARGTNEPEDRLDSSYLARLGLAERVDPWREACAALAQEEVA